MRIGFIGAGLVGTSLGIYFKNNRLDVVGYYSRSKSSSERASILTDSIAFDSLQELADNSEILFITTPDDAIEEVSNTLCQKNLVKQGHIIIHTSGVHTSESLKNTKERRAFCYSLHPLFPFSTIEHSVKLLKNAFFTLEGDAEKIEEVEKIIKTCGNPYFIISKEQKPLYHAGASVVSNYLVTLLDFGFKFFKKVGLQEEETIKALFALITATIENVKNNGTVRALTGPIARGDAGTIAKHKKAISEFAPELDELYSILGIYTLPIAKAKGKLDLKKEKEIFNILKEENKNE